MNQKIKKKKLIWDDRISTFFTIIPIFSSNPLKLRTNCGIDGDVSVWDAFICIAAGDGVHGAVEELSLIHI